MKKPAFTLAELLIAASVSAILIGITGRSYISIQRLVGRGENDLIIAQNARVVIDRISRDLRQAVSVTTSVPEIRIEASASLEFEDGHEINPAGPTYIKYELINDEIWRSRHYYYDESNPDIRLPFNPVLYEQGAYEVQELPSESYKIAENVTDLAFWGTDNLVQIDVELQDDPNLPSQIFHSAVAKRN